MTASHVLHSPPSGVPAGAAGQGLCLLAAGSTCSLRPAAAMRLRVVSGRAWVTLDGGPYGWREESGDVTLRAGQSLRVGAGRHAVVEPLGREPLRFQWHCARGSAASS